ncbi:MAG: energy-coupling factor transporter transmembrane protein EcfT [Clostridia bacterium]|nr:energy-coupling factor transporter transmembrane protein EcfT [Clostridia bacterium]
MFKDITIGQYYPADSFIHRLDPRLKIIGVMVYIIAAFFVRTYIGMAVLLGLLIAVVAASRLPVRLILRGMKAIYVLLFITFIFNAFLSGGQTEIFKLWIFRLTKEGLQRAVFMAIRLMLLITGASILTLTTTPISLTDGIERLLSPLARIRFPAHEVAMMMTIALRFIPTLMEETDRIIKAQSARGASFDEGGLIKRAKAVVPLLVPLFVSAFRRADELAMAMEARCYSGGEGRTRLHVLKYGKNDAFAGVVLALFVGMIVVDNLVFASAFPFIAGVL